MKKIKAIFTAIITILTTNNYSAIPLFRAHPVLADKLSYIELGNYPAPIYSAEELAKKLNIGNLCIIDDGGCGIPDQGDGIIYPSGNKMRKLSFSLAEAEKEGFKTVCTVGSAGSNHVNATAVCARMRGLSCVLLLNDQRPTSYTVRNLKLDVAVGATVLYSAAADDDELMIQAQKLCAKNNWYYIPMGGSNALGATGFVNAMFELKEQIDCGILPMPDDIIVTLGSAGTAAGIVAGAGAAGITSRIIPVRISNTPEFKTNLLLGLIHETQKLLHSLDPSFNATPIPDALLTTTSSSSFEAQMSFLQKNFNCYPEHNFAGHGYATITPAAAEAIDMFFEHMHIKLEGTYTGKTFSALIAYARSGKLKGKNVLFWNTFSHGDFEKIITPLSDEQIFLSLPYQLHHYLTDKLQALDTGISEL